MIVIEKHLEYCTGRSSVQNREGKIAQPNTKENKTIKQRNSGPSIVFFFSGVAIDVGKWELVYEKRRGPQDEIRGVRATVALLTDLRTPHDRMVVCVLRPDPRGLCPLRAP